MPTIKYSDNPNEETAFVTQDDGQRSRAVLTAVLDGTIEYPDNPNSTKVMVTVDGVKRRAVAVASVAGGGGGDQHNLGWYATESALTTAHATATDGDWAIVGATDTVWVWDSDTTAWKDTGQAGIELPDQTGQSGKFLTTDGINASWGTTISQPMTIVNTASAETVSLTIGNGSNTERYFKIVPSWVGTLASFYFGQNLLGRLTPTRFAPAINNYFAIGENNAKLSYVYTNKISNGADITIPNVAGELAVKQVNTTITLTAAGWSSNTQTVTVTGMTATGVVLVSPDPTDQSAYTSAGILATSQAANSLTFTCSTTPSADIDVNVVML